MQVDFCGYPHAIGISAYFLITVGFCTTCKNHHIFTPAALDRQRFISLIFCPSAPPPEDKFKPHAVAVANIQLCVGAGAASGKVYPIGAAMVQHIGKRRHIIHGFTCAHCSFGHTDGRVHSAGNVFLVFFTKLAI